MTLVNFFARILFTEKLRISMFVYVQIENHTLNFRARAQSKCGTFDYLHRIPLGGDKKVSWICIPTQCGFYIDYVY